MGPWIALLLSAALGAGEGLGDRLQEEALRFAQAQVSGQGGRYVFRPGRPPLVPALRPGEVTLEPSHLSKSDPSGPFFVTLRLRVDGQTAGTARVDLVGSWSGELYRSKVLLPRKQALEEDQFDKVPYEGILPPGALTEFPEGMRLRQPLQAGKWLSRADLEAIPLVNAGDRVRLTARCGDLVIQAEGTARGSGGRGERIRLEMPSHKLVTAQVSGSGEALLEFPK